MTSPVMPTVTVNGETIPSAAIALEAQNHRVPRGKPGLAWRAAARALIVRALLLQAAQAAGVMAAPEKLDDDHAETDEDALVRAYLEGHLNPAPVSDAACRAAYEKDPGAYRAPDLYMVSHILCAASLDDADARRQASERAAAALAKLRRAPEKFSTIAKELSDCPSGKQGGVLGQVGVGDTVPEFEAALSLLAPGEISSEPVETRFGFHIIRLDQAAKGRVLPYSAVSGRIQTALEKAGWVTAARELIEGLIGGAEITGIDIADPALSEVA